MAIFMAIFMTSLMTSILPEIAKFPNLARNTQFFAFRKIVSLSQFHTKMVLLFRRVSIVHNVILMIL